jgi:FtsP/CotA-like multicopper oxidase with cupredoxin domain
LQESRIKTAEIPLATPTEIVPLQAGGEVKLRTGWVRKRISDAVVPMLAYNGSIPGPTFVVAQDSQATVHFINEWDIETTVHWHGLRVDNLFDGVPHDTQAPVPHQGSFVYRLRFPDPGIYWYHPHMYEDYAQELGLYGSIIVTPRDPDFWPPANREYAMMIDDILMDGDQIAPFSHTHGTAPERFGNVMLVNGETPGRLAMGRGEVVRLYLTNTANVRDFNLYFPGARVKLIGGDNGRVEQEAFVNR